MRHLAQLLVVLPLVVVSLDACTSRRQDEHAASSANPSDAPSTGGDFAATRDRVVRQTQTKLAEIDTKLASLKRDAEARSAALSSDGRAVVADAVAKLEQQRTAAQRAVDDAKNSTAETWEQVKRHTDDALKNVDDAYDAAAKYLRD